MPVLFFVKGCLVGYVLAVVTILDLGLEDRMTLIGLATICIAIYAGLAFGRSTTRRRRGLAKKAARASFERLTSGGETMPPASPARAEPGACAGDATVAPRSKTPESARVIARNRIRSRHMQARVDAAGAF